jgi:DNA-binding response OmpR family regulator
MRVLLVEDHLQVRHVVARALRGAGYVVCEVGSGLAARERAEAERVDAAVIDISLPGEMHGVGFGRWLRRVWSGVPIVFVTGLMEWEMPEPVSQDVATRLLHKPFGALEIVGLVNGLVSARMGLGGISLAE